MFSYDNLGIDQSNEDGSYEFCNGGFKLSRTQSALSRMQEDIKFKYDDLDCNLDLMASPLRSSYRNGHELNLYQHLKEHNRTPHLQEQQQRLHHFYNGNFEKNILQTSRKCSSPPPKSVQPLRRSSSQNNNYQKNIGDLQSPQVTLEFPQMRYLDFDCCDTQSEYHYQYYYTWIYNRHLNTRKKSYKRRNLPTIGKMPSSKNILQSNEDLVLDKSNFYDHLDENNHRKNHILKEKAANNNDVSNYDTWLYDTANEHGADFMDTKSNDIQNYNTSKYFVEANYMGTSKPKRGSVPLHPKDEELCDYRRVNVYDDYDTSIGYSDNTIIDENGHTSFGMAASPKTYKGSFKKPSPPPKNRRVLIYSSQSPRLSNVLSHRRTQRSKTKAVECKSDATSKMVLGNRAQDSKFMILSKYATSKTNHDHSDGENHFSSEESDYDLDNPSELDELDDSDISSDSEECYRSHAFKLTHAVDAIYTTTSVASSLSSVDSLCNPETLLVPSLFPNVPPYLAFSSNAKKGPDVPADLYRVLKWRVTSVMPRVVRTILSNSGMRLLKKTNDWMGVWGKHMKSPCFKTVRPYQKINHLPGSFKIGRKDSCWKNLVKQMAKHGKKEFGFMPKTYIIPNDLKQLRKSWPKYSQRNVKWIIKPPASARGSGIRVVDRWAQIPKRKSLIVQKYIERPLLINGSKFDLRLYVLVTSMHPLRVYLYHNGLARFASVKYSDKSDTLSDRCMHLTNYSINKFSSNYAKNEDVNACHGHKWTIKSLWNFLGSRGVRTELLWDALRSLVLRTLIAGENSINNMIRTNVESKYSCFELFGFDVLLDADLIPWLLEVNISPSLHSELPLDAHVKAPLVQSVLNTALYNVPPKLAIERQKEIALEMALQPGPICYDKRIYINYLSRSEKIKHSTFTRKTMEDRDEYIEAILENLTPDDVRCLIIAEDELARSSPLERIFPTRESYKYLKYTDTPRYYNRLLDAWETRYGHNRSEGIKLLRRYCEEQYHLQVPQIPTKKKEKMWRAESYFVKSRLVVNTDTNL
ncbi:tubulin monoglutamylase TTLL4 isoform X2 [Stomoxys calcitrans]|uniref:tubulin monoglutamylase TTLL4 isoform X2 n=1 Tax=Stomoxys calcitrans TaxID=35570 RepID=UPI0027E2F519|nr:tubulin monoglutamylase TTLL4 isoform X2 [Stomoxys calcitrans]